MTQTQKKVSIPSRGSGKGDSGTPETLFDRWIMVSIPSRGSGKGDSDIRSERRVGEIYRFNPLSGKW